MEERRLKTILSHLSVCTLSKMGKSSASSQSINHSLCSPHLQNVPRTSISRSRSGSDIMESNGLGFADGFLVTGDAWHAAINEEVFSSGHSLASPTEGRCRDWKCSKGFFSRNSQEHMCLHERDAMMTRTQGYSFEVRGSNSLQGRNSDYMPQNCSSSDSTKLEWSPQCKSFQLEDELALGFQKQQIETSCSTSSAQRAYSHQGDVLNSSNLNPKDDCHQQLPNESQISLLSTKSRGNADGGSIQAFKGVHMHDVQPIDIKNDAVGSISRNNLMTGQRRCNMDDCVFCLIVQGQSPAFKLYEDDMCVCILDLRPLSHGHSLLITKSHFPSLELTPPEVAAAMCATVPLISMAIMQATNCDSFNLLVNSGTAAGQVVFHTHFHIIPRRTGDNLWRSEDGNRNALALGHETALLVQQIRHNLSSKCL